MVISVDWAKECRPWAWTAAACLPWRMAGLLGLGLGLGTGIRCISVPCPRSLSRGLFRLVSCFAMYRSGCPVETISVSRRDARGSLTRKLTRDPHLIYHHQPLSHLPHQASPHALELSIVSNKDSLNTSSIFTMTCPCSSCFASGPQYAPAQQHDQQQHQQHHPLPATNVQSSGKLFAKLRRTRSIESTTSTLVGLTANAQPMAGSDGK